MRMLGRQTGTGTESGFDPIHPLHGKLHFRVKSVLVSEISCCDCVLRLVLIPACRCHPRPKDPKGKTAKKTRKPFSRLHGFRVFASSALLQQPFQHFRSCAPLPRHRNRTRCLYGLICRERNKAKHRQKGASRKPTRPSQTAANALCSCDTTLSKRLVNVSWHIMRQSQALAGGGAQRRLRLWLTSGEALLRKKRWAWMR